MELRQLPSNAGKGTFNDHVLGLQQDAVEPLATGAPLSNTLTFLTIGVERLGSSGGLASILLLEAKTGILRHAVAPSIPDT